MSNLLLYLVVREGSTTPPPKGSRRASAFLTFAKTGVQTSRPYGNAKQNSGRISGDQLQGGSIITFNNGQLQGFQPLSTQNCMAKGLHSPSAARAIASDMLSTAPPLSYYPHRPLSAPLIPCHRPEKRFRRSCGHLAELILHDFFTQSSLCLFERLV